MKILHLLPLLLLAVNVFGQGTVRRVDSIRELLMVQPSAFATASKVSYEVAGYHAAGDSGVSRIVDWDRTSTLATNFGNVFPCRDGGRWVFRDREASEQDDRWWGVKGDGVTDDTVRLQAAADHGSAKLVIHGTPLVSHIEVLNPVLIEGYKATLLQLTNISTNILRISSSAVTLQGLTFDGRRKTARAIEVTNGVERVLIQSCVVTNLQEFTNKVTTIGLEIHGETEVTVRDCHFEDLYGLPDGVVGSGTGFNHGIYINRIPFSTTKKPKRVLVKDCFFRRILPGEDSDAIRWTDGLWTLDDANVLVDHCYFEDIGKRCIKASGSGGIFSNNTFTNSFDGATMPSGWADVGGYREQYAAISLYGWNHKVMNNRFNGGRIRYFVDTSSQIVGTNEVPTQDCEIAHNEMILSTNWGLNGLTVDTVSFGTIGVGAYMSHRLNIHDNVFEAVQFGIYLFNPDSDFHIFGNVLRNPYSVDGIATNNTGRGIRLGRYSTNYPAGALSRNFIVGNKITNFRGGLDLSESTNTVFLANDISDVEQEVIENATGPDGSAWPNQFYGGSTASLRLMRQLQLGHLNANSFTNTWDKGQVIFDTADQLPAFHNGYRWLSPDLGTREYSGSVTNTKWYRVAAVHTPGLGGRGTARITVGSAGGTTAMTTTFIVGINFYDATMFVQNNSPKASGGGTVIAEARVTHSVSGEINWLEIRPYQTVPQLGVEVVSDWTATVDQLNDWYAVPFTDSTTLTGDEVEAIRISGINTKSMAWKGDGGREWWIGLDKMAIGDWFLVDEPPTSVDTSLSTSVTNTLVRVKRDTGSGALYTGTANISTNGHKHAASDVTSGTFVGERLGSGTPTTNVVLWGGGAGQSPRWQTVPSTPSPTNGIADAPADGTFYGRRDNAWTGPAIGDISGLQTALDDRQTYTSMLDDGITAFNFTSLNGFTGLGIPLDTPLGQKPLVINGSFEFEQMTTNDFLTLIGAAAANHTHSIGQLSGLTNLVYTDSNNVFTANGNTAPQWTLSGTTPTLWFNYPPGNANARLWGVVDTGSLNFRAFSDDKATSTDWLTVDRSGTTVTNINLQVGNVGPTTGKIRANGTPIVTEAANDGVFRGRKNEAWAAPAITDVTGLSTSLSGKQPLMLFTNIVAGPNVTVTVTNNVATVSSSVSGAQTLLANGGEVTIGHATLTEGTIISLRSGESRSLAANALTTGTVLKLEAEGTMSSNGNENFGGGMVRFKVGGLVLTFTIDEQESGVIASGFSWDIKAYVTVQAAGSSATTVGVGHMDYQITPGAPGSPGKYTYRVGASASGTLNTTVGNTVDVTFQNNSGQELDFSCKGLAITRH